MQHAELVLVTTSGVGARLSRPILSIIMGASNMLLLALRRRGGIEGGEYGEVDRMDVYT